MQALVNKNLTVGALAECRFGAVRCGVGDPGPPTPVVSHRAESAPLRPPDWHEVLPHPDARCVSAAFVNTLKRDFVLVPSLFAPRQALRLFLDAAEDRDAAPAPVPRNALPRRGYRSLIRNDPNVR